MPHQFPHDLEFGTCSTEQRGIRPTKSVPPDALDGTYPLGGGTNMMTKKLLSPIWTLSSLLRTGEHPTLGRLIERSAFPILQNPDQMIVQRHKLLRLARPNSMNYGVGVIKSGNQ